MRLIEKNFLRKFKSMLAEAKSDTSSTEYEPNPPKKKQKVAHSKTPEVSSRDYPWVDSPQWQKSTLESRLINPAIQLQRKPTT